MFEEFKNLTLGKAIDVDGNWGPQCVDLFNYFNDLYNNGERINCLIETTPNKCLEASVT